MESTAAATAHAPQTRRQRGVPNRSSFVQSFYSNDSSPRNSASSPRSSFLGRDGGGDHFPVPRGRPMNRRASSRRILGLQRTPSETDRNGGGSFAASVPHLISHADEDDEDKHGGDNHRNDSIRSSGIERNNSWFDEALRQHGGNAGDLEAILGASGGGDEFPDEEIMEQHRIIARHEAGLRVKERTGFDILEYEKRRKLQAELDAEDNKPKASSISRLPEPAKVMLGCGSGGGGSSSNNPKPEEAPMIRPKFSSRFIKQPRKQVAELCGGIPSSTRGSTTLTPYEHVVRCLGCRNANKVHVLATLVSCPDCRTVSPASSTRR